MLRGDLLVDGSMASLRGGMITPELCVFITIRYLAGGSYFDISYFTGISKASFYSCVWRTIKAINQCKDLAISFPKGMEELASAAEGFESISTQACFTNVVGVIDGYHLQTITPPKNEVGNVRSYFSGHYQTYGVNIQACCDHQCRFQFIGVAGPGVMGDRDAIQESGLLTLISNLPGLYCTIGDCAYTPSEHLVPVFGGANALIPRFDNFNFFASQLRIRIEMAFGMMTQKWAILQHPLSCKIGNVKHLILAIGQLHNFCINERLRYSAGTSSYEDRESQTLTNHEQSVRMMAAEFDFADIEDNFESNWSQNRDRMVRIVKSMSLTRPGKNKINRQTLH